MSSVPSIPVMKVGNTVYEIKDLTAREHLIEVRDDQPTSEDNKLWVRETETEHSVPTWEEFQELYRKYEVLKERVDRLDPQGA